MRRAFCLRFMGLPFELIGRFRPGSSPAAVSKGMIGTREDELPGVATPELPRRGLVTASAGRSLPSQVEDDVGDRAGAADEDLPGGRRFQRGGAVGHLARREGG